MGEAKILIVDDEEKNIKLLKGMLLSENYHLFEACSGEEAIRLVREIGPDLILLDVMMPGLNGFEVCRRLKQNEETAPIPIVMVTALREKEHRIKALEVGADDFLSKPVDNTELVVRLKSLLRIKFYNDKLLASYQEIAAKNAQLLELEKTKDGLIHMIVHDLRNPLGAMLGYLDIMLFDKQKLGQNQIETLENCSACGKDLKEMIDGLLNISKMEEKKLELSIETVNLEEVIKEITQQFSRKAADKQLTLAYNSPGENLFVPVDRSLVKRIIANLLNNALRHTPGGGGINITAAPDKDNGHLKVAVKDTGNGLLPEYHQKVFEKFEQVKLKKSGVAVGASGLGLAFCKLAVEAHGGKIWVESEGEGKGATFQFTLPVDNSSTTTCHRLQPS